MPRTRTGPAAIVLTVVVALGGLGASLAPTVVAKWDEFTTWVGDRFDNTRLVGEGDAQLLVHEDAEGAAKACGAAEIVKTKKCDKLPVLILDADKMKFVTRNTAKAWDEGKSGILTRGDDATEKKNRSEVCKPSFPRTLTGPRGESRKGQCDEYALASTYQGGKGAREMLVPPYDNRCQGGTVSSFYQSAEVGVGDSFMVAIRNPDKISPRDVIFDDLVDKPGVCTAA